MLNKNKVLICSETFWSYAKQVYPMFGNWHLKDPFIQKITRKKIGLEFIETKYKQESFNTIFIFKIVNRKKYAFAKIKYGI